MTDIKNRSFSAFIPRHLEIKERPELNIFPYNVLIAMYRVNSEGKTERGLVIYEPDLSTYKDSELMQSMRYQNIYGSISSLLILYDKSKKSYECEKYLNGERIGLASGPNWNSFFVHVGVLGLADREPCLIETAIR